jgi:hypothetical protein
MQMNFSPLKLVAERSRIDFGCCHETQSQPRKEHSSCFYFGETFAAAVGLPPGFFTFKATEWRCLQTPHVSAA